VVQTKRPVLRIEGSTTPPQGTSNGMTENPISPPDLQRVKAIPCSSPQPGVECFGNRQSVVISSCQTNGHEEFTMFLSLVAYLAAHNLESEVFWPE
jgi:hypothetical protein